MSLIKRRFLVNVISFKFSKNSLKYDVKKPFICFTTRGPQSEKICWLEICWIIAKNQTYCFLIRLDHSANKNYSSQSIETVQLIEILFSHKQQQLTNLLHDSGSYLTWKGWIKDQNVLIQQLLVPLISTQNKSGLFSSKRKLRLTIES